MRGTGQSENKLSDKMTFSDHLEELRQRILNSIYSILISIFFSFLIIKPLISFLEIPAGDIHLLQLAPGEFLFVAIKVAGYSGLIVSFPYIIYQIILFISPGLTKQEKSLILPAVFCSGLLFFLGLIFSWWILVPAAINFFITFGADIVEPTWSIERYFDFVLLLMSSTAIAFQLPVLQFILGSLGIITTEKNDFELEDSCHFFSNIICSDYPFNRPIDYVIAIYIDCVFIFCGYWINLLIRKS